MRMATLVIAPLVGMLVTLLASLAPAVRASRVAPLAALRDVDGRPLGDVGRSAPSSAACCWSAASSLVVAGASGGAARRRRARRAAHRRVASSPSARSRPVPPVP